MLKETYMRLRYFIMFMCYGPHVLILLLRNCANVGNIYNLSPIELQFLKLATVTGVALLAKLSAIALMFLFVCQRSVCSLKFFMLLYGIDLFAGMCICMDSFFRRELWKPHLTEDIHNVSIVETAYVSLVGIAVFVDGFNITITWKAMKSGHFRRRSIMSKEFKAYLNNSNKKPRQQRTPTKKKKKRETDSKKHLRQDDDEKQLQQKSSLRKGKNKRSPTTKVSFATGTTSGCSGNDDNGNVLIENGNDYDEEHFIV